MVNLGSPVCPLSVGRGNLSGGAALAAVFQPRGLGGYVPGDAE